MKSIVLFLSLLLAFNFSCSTQRPEGKTEAEVLYREAQRLIKNERFLLANEKLNLIRSKFPYSYFATHAELLSADVLFSQENYAEAAAAYIVFKDFHPKYKDMSYVIYRIAESFFMQLPETFDRDLNSGLEAIKYYNELLRIFPNSEYAKQAKEKVTYCRELIWKKEKYIADFYFKTEVFDSARFRYRGIIRNYKLKDLVDHSVIRLVLSSVGLNEKQECLKDYRRFGDLVSKERQSELKEALTECNEIQEQS